MACTFQATIGGTFAPLIGLSDKDMDMDTMFTTYNTAVTDAASEILGKERRRKKQWVTKDVLDLCDERRNLKKKLYEAEGAKEYREANRRIQRAVKKAKEDWIGAQCEEIETCLNKPILFEEVEIAVASLKKRKSAGVDNIPAELVQAGGETMIDVLTEICNRIWRTGEWPTPWTQSLIITLPKKVNLQLCQNYRTISLISHSSKVMLKVILKRLKP